MRQSKDLIFEISKPGRTGYSLPKEDDLGINIADHIDQDLLRQESPELPEVSEGMTVRHYTALSNRNFGVDSGFYPLGSCTMKYNPKINEDIARYGQFVATHPYQREDTVQGNLEVLYRLNKMLQDITGMARFTLHPSAGAHGEHTGLMIIKAYHMERKKEKEKMAQMDHVGQATQQEQIAQADQVNQQGHGQQADQGENRTKVIIPDSAHGTNPASASMCGFDVIEVKSNDEGLVDIDSLKEVVGNDTAALMLTNPNTLGLFERDIVEIAEIVHNAGGLLYYDGANANAILGKVLPSEMGFDVIHLNLHKTFGTPHGGGGPGSGPVGVTEELLPYLPVPVVEKQNNKYVLNYDYPLSIGKIRGAYGNFGVLLKAFAYILSMGGEGLKRVAEDAVLNANYLMTLLKGHYDLPYENTCMHEFVLSCIRQKNQGASTLDIAKRLIDYGIHPPTVYFPLIVKEALMIEPTETAEKESLDEFAKAMIEIAREIEEDADKVQQAPYTTVVGRLDEVKAARKPVVRWEG